VLRREFHAPDAIADRAENAPRTCPNSSLSRSSAGSGAVDGDEAVLLTRRLRVDAREDFFPVPLSGEEDGRRWPEVK
jgi:hypothetical protein